MILSGGGGNPCIHPNTRGSDACADKGGGCVLLLLLLLALVPSCAPALEIATAASDAEHTAASAAALVIDHDIDERS
jgi:hypothetical protein